jgi:hypothetical protein
LVEIPPADTTAATGTMLLGETIAGEAGCGTPSRRRVSTALANLRRCTGSSSAVRGAIKPSSSSNTNVCWLLNAKSRETLDDVPAAHGRDPCTEFIAHHVRGVAGRRTQESRAPLDLPRAGGGPGFWLFPKAGG